MDLMLDIITRAYQRLYILVLPSPRYYKFFIINILFFYKKKTLEFETS
jgi:hypothetical protein